jgi:FMN phosphatase YigB (HAD superfamily)
VGHLSREEFIHQVSDKIAYSGNENDFAQAYVDIFTPNEPIWALIEKLSPHYPLYLLSNISALHLDYLRRTYTIFSHFSGGAYSFLCRCAKPHDGIYHDATSLCGSEPEQIIYLDDLAPNVATAQRHSWRAWQYAPTDHARCLAWLRDQGLAVSV